MVRPGRMMKVEGRRLIMELTPLLSPATVAVAGAGENLGSMGARTLQMIADYGFAGGLYAINPQGRDSGGHPGYRQVRDLPERPDLCLVAVPASAAVKVVAECADLSVPFVQVLTSGSEGSFEFDRELIDAADARSRLLGPNCVGTHAPSGRITFMRHPDPTPGTVSIVSQSGGLSIDFVNQSAARGMPIRAIISAGNCADVSLAELVSSLADDSETSVIGVYLEGVADGLGFVHAVRYAVARKPVVVLKGGTSQAGSDSAASHTGAVAVSHETWRAVMHQIGAIEATDPDDLLAKLSALRGEVPILGGDRLAVLGNGGGMTVLTTDALEGDGLRLAALTEQTKTDIEAMDTPPGSTLGNPSDIPAGSLNAVGTDTLAKVLRRLLEDPGVDGAVLHFNLVALLNYGDPELFAHGLGNLLVHGAIGDKPVYAGLRSTPDPDAERLRQIVLRACTAVGIPTFRSGLEAARAAVAARRRTGWLEREDADTPTRLRRPPEAATRLHELIDRTISHGQQLTPFVETSAVLEAYGLACVATQGVEDANAAAATVDGMGGPVAIKLDVVGLSHKSDVGGVRLGIKDGEQARRTYEQLRELAASFGGEVNLREVVVQAMASADHVEMLVGMHRDPVLGPVIVVGFGGVLVEAVGDVAIRLAPVTETEAARMLSELRSARMLGAFRGAPARDVDALAELIARFSELATDCPVSVAAIDLNPVLVGPVGQGAQAVDWRIVIDQDDHRSR